MARRGAWLVAIVMGGLAPLGVSAVTPPAAKLIAQASAELNRGDGVAAEVHLRQAMAAGATKPEVAAALGDAYIQQNDYALARKWLAPGDFAPDQKAYGFRTLGLLERFERNLPAAGRAYDRVLALTPNDSLLWIDIARLRYLGGEQAEAIAATDRALQLNPANFRALGFRAELIRDQFGGAASLPWFEAALARAPNDLILLGEYAGSLGEVGRARDMLVVTRKMIERDPRNPRAFYLQAVLAARAGRIDLARSLLNHAGSRLDTVPGATLLKGILDLEDGNTASALTAFERLGRLQPANPQIDMLIAKALYAAGDHADLVGRFAALSQRPDAAPYLLLLVGRAYEALGHRDLAAPLLDRAAEALDPPVMPIAESTTTALLAPRYAERPYALVTTVPYLRALLGSGQFARAETIAEQLRAGKPGSGDAQALAGDVQLALRRGPAAAERYRAASAIRQSDGLLMRQFAALTLAGQGLGIGPLADNYLAMNPQNRAGARLAAGGAAAMTRWGRSVALLKNLQMRGGNTDPRLLADLSLAQLRLGDKSAALATAQAGYRLQPSNRIASQAYAMALIANGERDAGVRRLLVKARAGGADNPLLAQARIKLTG